MSSAVQFILAVLILLSVWMAWSLRGLDFKAYFKTKSGEGILKGIVLAVAFAAIFAAVSLLSGCAGTYLNDASIYAGLDYTKKTSPQCEPIGADSHTTSNIGLRANMYESKDGKFRANAKYTHHSCAFSPDDLQYDAIGVELEYKFIK